MQEVMITMDDDNEAGGYEQVECEKQENSSGSCPSPEGDIKEALERLI